MKSTKICRSYIQIDTIFCPHCGDENEVPKKFYKVKNEEDFVIFNTCNSCGQKYKINWIKEN